MSIAFWEVTKNFGPKRILDNVSFDVATGEILFILGKSGMGKSVTLKHIVGVLKPDSGAIIVDGMNVTKLDEDGLAEIRRRCGMVFQHPALLDSLTVYQNVSFGLRTPQFARTLRRTLSEEEIRARAIEKLALVHLGPELLERRPQELSYGMQKRVSLARTLAPEPRYLLFDEPTTGLDPVTTNAVNDLILELSRKLKVTSIVVSHDMACALKVADRILVLDQARILAWGTVPEIKRSQEPLIRDFLSETLALLPPEER
ncbi:MAG: ATP-binding cassette domain-containing protein [Oligoflexia bacterium]|nr:ATP-binding cassette domain-containing protein [Oligoflexia bacterium]